jgi:predicted membrane-bound spermidine synthase
MRQPDDAAAPPARLAALQWGVLLITFSGLVFEIGLTRIFSATIWYHYTFVAISVALLGWGLAGFALHALRRRVRASLDTAGLMCLLYAACIPVSLWLIVRNPFQPERLPLYFAVSALPFFLAGLALTMVFTVHRERAGRLYLADLLGASTGAAAVAVLLAWLGGEGAVLASALAPAAAAALLSRRLRVPAALASAVVLAALFAQVSSGTFGIRSAPNKGMYQHMAAHPQARVALTGWNAYSRIDAVAGYPDSLARLYIDSDAWTNVQRWDGRVESLAPMRGWYRALPFHLFEKPRALVIGPGGGSDVLVALASGSPEVTAVELNPLVLEFVRHFGAQAGHLYDHPQVRTVLSEGRNFLSRHDGRYDVVFLGFVDSWAAVASGGLSLSENYLYTVEAFRAYYDHLTDDGVLVIMRWADDVPRLVSNSVALLGAAAAPAHVAVVMEKRGTAADPPQMIFMLRRRPFTEAEGRMLAEQWTQGQALIVPGRPPGPPYDALLAGSAERDQYVADTGRRVDAVTDDRPFFFARYAPWGLPQGMMLGLGLVAAPVALLSLLFIVRGRPRLAEGRTGYGASVVYFACLGAGFIALELALLQHLTLLLGHPVFTLSVILFTLLAAGGIGAGLSGRFAPSPVCFTIAGLGVGYALALPRLVPALLPLPLAARVVVTVLLVAPLGLAMGMPFPRGLRQAGRGLLPPPAFYWGLNGVLSVIGSISTVLVAVNLGFQVVMLAASACYVGAALAWPRLSAVEEPAPVKGGPEPAPA